MKKLSLLLLGLLGAAASVTGALLPYHEFSVNTYPGPMDLPEPAMINYEFEVQGGKGGGGYGFGGGVGALIPLTGGAKAGGYGAGASIATVIPIGGGGGGGGKKGPPPPPSFGGYGGGIGPAIVLGGPVASVTARTGAT